MKEKLTVLNAFVHDMATGTWVGTLVLLTILHEETQKPGWLLAGPLLPPLERKFLVVTWVSLAVVVLTGIFRALSWKVFGWTGDVERTRIRLLMVKHVLLALVFVAATVWQAVLVYG